MQVHRPFDIIGIGKYLPNTVVSSKEIETDLGLPSGWIEKYIGVEQRHIARTESNSEMGARALEAALDTANLSVGKLDCLIGASATFDHVIPNRSSLIKAQFTEALKYDFPCIDINTVCTSFITALEYAALLIESGAYCTIGIVTSEISSKGLDPTNTETYCLFGDGAAAMIISKSAGGGGLIKHITKTYSEGALNTIIEAGGNKHHPRDTPYSPAAYGFKMDGRKLLKLANKHLEEFIAEFLSNDITPKELGWIVPHQASKLGLRMLKSLPMIDSLKVIDKLASHGNLIAASVPLTLISAIEDGQVRQGDNCFLIGTAAGMSISGLLFKYTSS